MAEKIDRVQVNIDNPVPAFIGKVKKIGKAVCRRVVD
jgi:hypothetical protein